MTDRNQRMRDALKEIEATVTTTLAQQPEDDEKCGQALHHALVKVRDMADLACHKARGERPAPATVATGVEISAELRDVARSIRMRICCDVPPPTMCNKPLDVYFDELADRLEAAHKCMEWTHKKELETRDAVIQTEVAAREAEREAHKREVDAIVLRRNELNDEVAAKDAVIMRLDAEIRKYQEERELRIAAQKAKESEAQDGNC